MHPRPCQPADEHPCKVEILDAETVWEFGFFRVTRVRLRHERFNGEMSEVVTRINFERGDSVGVLLHDPRGDTVILVRQFRYPVYASLDAEVRDGPAASKAWSLEVVAGVLDAGRTVREVATKERVDDDNQNPDEDCQLMVGGDKATDKVTPGHKLRGGQGNHIDIYQEGCHTCHPWAVILFQKGWE